MDAATFWVFLVAITLLTISPGVDTVLVIRNSTRGGLLDGFVTTLAICTGLFVHATVSAVGISVILLQSAFLFSVLKLAGAAYLIWLGAVSLWQAYRGPGLDFPRGDERKFVLLRSIREGLLSNLLNPKPIVFYMALLPQFIDPAGGSALGQSLFLAFIHFVISVAWLGLVAAMVDRMRRWLSRDAIRRALDAAVGAALGCFGIGLAWEAIRRES